VRGLAVDLDRSVEQRANDVVGGVLQREQVALVLPAKHVGHRHERLNRAVPLPSANTGQRGIDARNTLLNRDHAVG
jgi:hypothetical protein